MSGLAIDELLGNVDMQAGIDLARLDQNGYSRARASRTNLQSNLNRVEQPDYAGAVAGIATQSVAAYQNQQTNQTRTRG